MEKFLTGKEIINHNKKVIFQNKLDEYYKKNNIDFEKLSENKLLEIYKLIKEDIQEQNNKIEDNKKNYETNWTILLNTILNRIGEEDSFLDLFEKIEQF